MSTSEQTLLHMLIQARLDMLVIWSESADTHFMVEINVYGARTTTFKHLKLAF